MSEKEKRELLNTITALNPEDKAFVTGYAAGVAAKVAEHKPKAKRRAKTHKEAQAK